MEDSELHAMLYFPRKYIKSLSSNPFPTGTWRNNNAIVTSKRRRFDVNMMSLLRFVSARLTKDARVSHMWIDSAMIPKVIYYSRYDTWHPGVLLLYRHMDIMMTSSNGNIFRVTGHLCGEFTGPRWIPRTKASDAELWWFLWSASK